MGKVFIIPFHVKPIEGGVLPSGVSGAYVSCYTSGEEYVDAVKKSLMKLSADGLEVQEILQPIHEMEPESWEKHVKEVWGGYSQSLPTQGEFVASMAKGDVVYGPFGTYV